MFPSSDVLMRLGLLALAGAAGTLCRYWIGGLVQRLAGAAFPWGTLIINASGCLLFGIVFALAQGRMLISTETRFIILTGFMGAYTTFSTFGFETQQQLERSQWLWAGCNILGQNGLGILCVFVGLALGRLL